MSRFTLFAVAIVALAGVATASVNSDWAGCMCWDESRDRMCASSNTYCNRLIVNEAPTLSGLAVAVLAALFFLFFPIFFACGRCCNCCGGRNPSYGCCCPYKRFGSAQRFYSASTVHAARFWAVVVFLALGGSAWYLSHSISDAANTLDRISNFALSLAADAQTLTSEANAAVPTVAQYGVDPINIDLNGTIRTLHDISHSMTYSSPHVRRGLYGEYLPAAVALVVCLLAFIGIRGIVITSTAMLMSFFACLFLFGLTVAGAGAMAGNFACDSSRADTTQAFINRSLEINQLSRTVTNGVNQAETALLGAMCNDLGLATLCSGEFECAFNSCDGSWPTVDAAVMSVNAIIFDDSSAWWNASVSIADCAQNVSCPLYSQTNRLVQAFGEIYPALLLLSPGTNSIVARAINGDVGVQVMNLLCGSEGARGSALKLTYGFLMMSISCILAMIFYIRGAKRFSKGSPVRATLAQPLAYGDYIAIPAQQEPPLPQQQHRAWGAPATVEATPMLYGVQVQQQPQYTVNYGAAKSGSDTL